MCGIIFNKFDENMPLFEVSVIDRGKYKDILDKFEQGLKENKKQDGLNLSNFKAEGK